LVTAGAKVAALVSDACEGEAVITMLANDVALIDVAESRDGVLASLKPGAIHISMSTISVALAERLARAHAEAGQQFVSAPVFGRPDAAAAAKLSIVVSGAAQAVERVKPLFAAMGQLTLPVSENPRDANLVKISGNFMIASVLESLGEAIALIRKAGVPAETFVNVLTSTLFNAPVYKTYGGIIAAGKFSPAGFAAPLGYKDIGLALEAADTLRVPMPLASLISDRFLRLLAQGGEQLDWSAIARLSATDAGLEESSLRE
jgi:3-hydroxyisobutyrate dehydrogenase-like beta-hydroxyacid dehydrogenase